MRVASTLLLVTVLSVAGCARVAVRDSLAGTWYAEAQGPNGEALAVTETFKRDGTLEGHATSNGHRVWNFKGEWILIDERIHTRYTQSDLAAIPVGKKGTDRIVELTREFVIFENEDGVHVKYARLPGRRQPPRVER